MRLDLALRRICLAAIVACVLAVTCSARADRLHLESGGAIDAAAWWIEGDWLIYEGPDGTIGIPRATVVRIEKTGGGKADPPASAKKAAARRAATPRSADVERMREIVRKGNDALSNRDFEIASSYFLEVINAVPELYAARVGYTVSEIALGRDGLALSVVQDGLALDPDRPELHELLGDLRYRDERTDDAMASWRRAFELSPSDRLREKILKAEREQLAARDYDFAATSHFNLRYDGDVALELATAVMDYLEQQYWELSDLYRHAPPQPITVQLFPTREFREVTRSPEWVGGLYDGKIRVPLGGLTRLNPGAESVLRHELTHAVVHSKTRGNCPRWLHEGLAQISEDKTLQRSQRQQIAQRLRGADATRWDEKEFSYPMALSLTRHLESVQGHAALVYLLQLLGEGRELDAALQQVYGEDYPSLCRSWARAVLGEERR